jgi:transcriptional regulator with XRE-family HTH domain
MPNRTAVASIDARIGSRIRERRDMLGLSIHQLGEMSGLSAHQAYKYESGTNRLSAGRLYVMARALSVPVDYFFEGPSDEAGRSPREQMCLEFARNFYRIENEKHRQAMGELVRTLTGR